MSILDRVRELGTRAVGHGRSRIDRVRSERRRQQLLRELGEAHYAGLQGTATSLGEIDRIVGELDALDRDDEPATDGTPLTSVDDDLDASTSGPA